MEHKEYLAQDSVDSRYELALRLYEDIPKDGTVLAYNMSFEKGVITRLATLFEELSFHLLAINENMQDLMIPFQKKWYVTPLIFVSSNTILISFSVFSDFFFLFE